MQMVLAFARGARQLVVQEALDTMSSFFGSYFSSFTPITNMGASAGATVAERMRKHATELGRPHSVRSEAELRSGPLHHEPRWWGPW